tara:strand:- start:587 stop:862 length:276 start_codon:yes stop_codon:yes gene_type:complete
MAITVASGAFFGYDSDPGENVYPAGAIEMGDQSHPSASEGITVLRNTFAQFNFVRKGTEQMPFYYTVPGPGSLRMKFTASIIRTDTTGSFN